MPAKSLKIGILGDVHGNLPALEAVLADFKKNKVEQIWNLGDFVGYIPYPNEVIERLRKEQAVNIIGNYDLKVLEFARKARQWKKSKSPEKYAVFEWNYKNLSLTNKCYLRSLPKERRIKISGIRILLTHGSPADNEEGIGPEISVKRLKELAKIAKADVVLCGHTHQPFKKSSGSVLFVNSGSVGRPEGDTRASYAIMKLSDNRFTVRHYKVKYNIKRATGAIRKAALSVGLIDVLEKAESLDILKKHHQKYFSKNVTDEKRLKAVLTLAKKCNYEKQHTHQVEKLSLELFDRLTKLHRLTDKERFLLRCGALLHDIGWIEGQQGHHKTALKIIMENKTLPFDFRDIIIIALLTRYHRKRLPASSDNYYRQLNSKEQVIIQKLAGILRVADGLDRTHRNLIKSINCDISGNRILLQCGSKALLDEEFSAAGKKANLFKQIFGKNIVFRRKPC